MRKLYQILYNVGRLTDAPGGGRFLSRGDTLAWAGLRGGKALGVTKPAFPPRAPPFRARYIVVRCGNVLMYWHGDVFYGIDNATLHRCIHPAPLCSSIFLCIDISSRRHCIATTTHLQVDSETPRPILPRQATGKLSLSSQSSSAALMTHPTPGKPPHFPL